MVRIAKPGTMQLCEARHPKEGAFFLTGKTYRIAPGNEVLDEVFRVRDTGRSSLEPQTAEHGGSDIKNQGTLPENTRNDCND